MRYILGTLAAMLIVMAVSYIDRGYFAFGIEIFFPIVGLIAYKTDKVKRAS
jgi:hypothetical protein